MPWDQVDSTVDSAVESAVESAIESAVDSVVESIIESPHSKPFRNALRPVVESARWIVDDCMVDCVMDPRAFVLPYTSLSNQNWF